MPLPEIPISVMPVVSITPSIEMTGVHQISLPPGTELKGPPVFPSVGVQLANLSPDLVAILGFFAWGTWRNEMVTAAGFIIALIAARMQPARPGAGGAETIVRGVAGVVLRVLLGRNGQRPS